MNQNKRGAAKFTPLYDKVIIRRDKADDTIGEIVIPDRAKRPVWRGEVVSAGPGRFLPDGSRRPLDVKPGDRVLVGEWKGDDISVDDETFLLVREDQILGVLYETT